MKKTVSQKKQTEKFNAKKKALIDNSDLTTEEGKKEYLKKFNDLHSKYFDPTKFTFVE